MILIAQALIPTTDKWDSMKPKKKKFYTTNDAIIKEASYILEKVSTRIYK